MSSGVAAGELVRPVWQRLRFWVVLAVVVVLGALLIGSVSGSPGRSLDPDSPAQNGSKALARLLERYDVPVTRTTSLATALRVPRDATLLVTAPADYSDVQLDRLAAVADRGSRVVLVRPGSRTLERVAPDISPEPAGTYLDRADCGDAGMQAAGTVDWPDGVVPYSGGTTNCFGGVVVQQGNVLVLGSAESLRNDQLGDAGTAAVAVNAVGRDRTASRVVWLLPGPDAGGSGPASIWDLFPAGAYRVFWWVAALGLLVALWRGRRLGGVVTEPLPVVVRNAELVEGHGRLYERSGARDRASAALRQGSVARLAAALALPRSTPPHRVAGAVADRLGRDAATVSALLTGPVPADDVALVRLARQLADLEADTETDLRSEGHR